MPRAPKLKMWIGNLDGRRQGLVIASSKVRARIATCVGRADFDGYWTLQSSIDITRIPEMLYTRLLGPDHAHDPWFQGRCPLPPKKAK